MRHPHPSARELAAHVARSAGRPGARNGAGADPAASPDGEIRRHLSSCPECRRIVDDLEGRGAAVDPERDRAWEALRARLPPGHEAAGHPAPPPPRRRRPVRAALLAAAVLLLALAIGWALASRHDLREARERMASLEAELADATADPWDRRTQRDGGGRRDERDQVPGSPLAVPVPADDGQAAPPESGGLDENAEAGAESREPAQPHARIASVDLLPRGALRDGDPTASISLTAGMRLALLRLLLSGSGEGVPHRVVAELGGRTLWTVSDAVTDSLEQVTIAVPVERLPDGIIDLTLVPPARAPVEYTLQVDRADE